MCRRSVDPARWGARPRAAEPGRIRRSRVYQLTALYSHPEDAAAFDKHYREVHAELATKLPGLQDVHDELARARPGRRQAVLPLRRHARLGLRGGVPGRDGRPEGEAAMADLPNFAGAGVRRSLTRVRAESRASDARSRQAAHHLLQDRARVAKFSRAWPRPGAPHSGPSTSATPVRSQQHLRRVVAEPERAQVEPGEVGALGEVEADLRQVLGEQVREGVPVAVEVGQHPVEPRAAVRVRRGRRHHPERRHAVHARRSGAAANAARSASLDEDQLSAREPGQVPRLGRRRRR